MVIDVISFCAPGYLIFTTHLALPFHSHSEHDVSEASVLGEGWRAGSELIPSLLCPCGTAQLGWGGLVPHPLCDTAQLGSAHSHLPGCSALGWTMWIKAWDAQDRTGVRSWEMKSKQDRTW